ncbi:hypothetical protein [Ottowia sp. VDI28]|uniref:hypothetical protein n=1 Tax=Ottowia sp. VDI28 TaxID=3133968 RepID=UPI003C2BD7DD
MNEAQQNLLLVRGAIYALPDADRKGVELAAVKLREVVALHNDLGKMAIVLVASELAAEE